MRSLYERGYEREDVRKLFRLIDWFMQLPPEVETRFQHDLEEYEEQHHMPYVTAIERMAEARGKAEGEARGKAEGEARGRILSKIETLLLAIETRFGAVGSEMTKAIQSIENEERLTLLHKQAILAPTIGEFTEFLDKHQN